jgi:DNA-binding IclR family transcriptional regulator
MTDTKRSTTVHSLERGLEVLAVIAEADRPIGITDLSREMGLAKGSISRIVTTLAQLKFITRDPETARYRAGTRLWELGYKSMAHLNIGDVARPVMEEINALTHEAVNISLLNDNGQMVFLHKIDSNHAVRPNVQLGTYHPPYCVALGKALLSVMTPEEVEKILPPVLEAYTDTTITDRDELMAHLEEIRALGYAPNHGEYRSDLSGVAAPIFDHSSRPIASIGIVLPTSRMTETLEKELGQAVAKGGRAISQALGWME